MFLEGKQSNTAHPGLFKKKARVGFTLIEILVVLSMLSLIAGIGMPVTLNMYRSYLFNSDISTLLTLLQKARSLSANKADGQNYGVRIEPNKIILFAAPYQPNNNGNQTYYLENLLPTNNTNEITFSPTGTTIESKQITFTNGYEQKTISINSFGEIEQ